MTLTLTRTSNYLKMMIPIPEHNDESHLNDESHTKDDSYPCTQPASNDMKMLFFGLDSFCHSVSPSIQQTLLRLPLSGLCQASLYK